jgi:hypothetical protein
MGGVAAAAADGSLPAPLQDLAHALFGAPPAHPNSDDGKGDLGGTAPFPMPTDASTRSPSPEGLSATSPTAVPTDLPTPEPCTPELALPESCEVVADAEPEVGDVLEPGPTPTSAPELDVTDSDGSDTAPTTPQPSPYEMPEPSSAGHSTGPPSWVPVPTGPPGWSSSSGHPTGR